MLYEVVDINFIVAGCIVSTYCDVGSFKEGLFSCIVTCVSCFLAFRFGFGFGFGFGSTSRILGEYSLLPLIQYTRWGIYFPWIGKWAFDLITSRLFLITRIFPLVGYTAGAFCIINAVFA